MSRRLLGTTQGNAMLEFALLAPLLFAVLFGITEFGRAIHTSQALHAAAREGARLAIVTGPDVGAVNDRVNEVLAAAGVTASSIQVQGPAGTPESTVTVTVQSEFDVIPGEILGTFSGTITLEGTAIMRFEG